MIKFAELDHLSRSLGLIFDGLKGCSCLVTWIAAGKSICKREAAWEQPLLCWSRRVEGAEFEEYGTFVTIDKVIEEVDVMMFTQCAA